MERFLYGLKMISVHTNETTNKLTESNMIGLANTCERARLLVGLVSEHTKQCLRMASFYSLRMRATRF